MYIDQNKHPFNIRSILASSSDGNLLTYIGDTITYGFGDGTDINILNIASAVFDKLERYIEIDFILDNQNPQIVFKEDPLTNGGFASLSFGDEDGLGGFARLEAEVVIGFIDDALIIHEIGHALLLEHTSPNQNPPHQPFLESQFQNNNYTVMHYDLSGDTRQGIPSDYGEWDYNNFQLFDVYALQKVFGSNLETYSGNTTHTAASLGVNSHVQVLWDADGYEDTIDMSDQGIRQIINLQEGSFSRLGPVVGSNPDRHNISIAYGSRIENAIGGSSDDIITGNDSFNQLYGNEGNDEFYLHNPRNYVFGGEGKDKIIYDFERDEAIISTSALKGPGNGRIGNPGPDFDYHIARPDSYIDRIQSIEKIEFSDGAFIFDIDATDNLKFAYRLYDAAFDRTPDESGLKYWAGELDSNRISRDDVAFYFLSSEEFMRKYGTLTDSEYIHNMYRNILNREGDSDGLQFWNNVIENTAISREDILVYFSESDENIKNNLDNYESGIWVSM